MLFMNTGGMNSLLSDEFTMGGDASVAAGPVGRQAGASTDLKLTAQILSYSRSKGLFAGLELKGVVIPRASRDDMSDVYGAGMKAKQVLKGIARSRRLRCAPSPPCSSARGRDAQPDSQIDAGSDSRLPASKLLQKESRRKWRKTAYGPTE